MRMEASQEASPLAADSLWSHAISVWSFLTQNLKYVTIWLFVDQWVSLYALCLLINGSIFTLICLEWNLRAQVFGLTDTIETVIVRFVSFDKEDGDMALSP